MRRYAVTAMGRSLSSARYQSPVPVPIPVIPFTALPFSRSSELKWYTANAAIRNDVRRSAPSSSRARTETVPARSERLTTRANPCRMPSSAGANSGTVCVSPAASAADSRKTGSKPAVRVCTLDLYLNSWRHDRQGGAGVEGGVGATSWRSSVLWAKRVRVADASPLPAPERCGHLPGTVCSACRRVPGSSQAPGFTPP